MEGAFPKSTIQFCSVNLMRGVLAKVKLADKASNGTRNEYFVPTMLLTLQRKGFYVGLAA